MVVETLTYVYTTQAEIGRRFSVQGATVRADDTEDQDAESEVWSDICDEATDIINMYTSEHYAPVDQVKSKLIRGWASWIGAYLLSQRRGDPGLFFERYEQIIALLERILLGKLEIPRLVKQYLDTPGMSNYRIDRRYGIAKIRVQQTISTGGTYSGQHLDPQYPRDYYR